MTLADFLLHCSRLGWEVTISTQPGIISLKFRKEIDGEIRSYDHAFSVRELSWDAVRADKLVGIAVRRIFNELERNGR